MSVLTAEEAQAELGIRMARAIEDAGLTKMEVARRVHVVPSTVSGWLSGRRMPSPIQVQSVATLTGRTATDLLGGLEVLLAQGPSHREDEDDGPKDDGEGPGEAEEAGRGAGVATEEGEGDPLSPLALLRDALDLLRARDETERLRIRQVDAVAAEATRMAIERLPHVGAREAGRPGEAEDGDPRADGTTGSDRSAGDPAPG